MNNSKRASWPENSGQPAVLVVDDDRDILAAARLLLRKHFKTVTTVADPQQIVSHMAEADYPLVLLDMNFTAGRNNGEEGFYWLRQILEHQPDTVVVMMTAFGDVETAVRAIKEGATDFVLKPWHNEKVLATLAAAEMLCRSRRQVALLRQANQELNTEGNLLGQSALFMQTLQMVERAAPTDANVLILGENGTGKEMVARDIHRRSLRRDEVFVSIDLGAVPENLFESELFGHKKGAFTGADRDRVGRIQAACGGTLFLDEIGNLPLHLQSKLLTALEQRQIVPVGGNQPINIDVRVISATNMPLPELADESRFRQDLLFRINTVELRLPSLRDRVGDIPVLANHFLAEFKRKYDKPELQFSAEATEQMQRNQWRGNVRELRHSIERAVILSESNQLQAVHFEEMGVASKSTDDTLQTCNLEEVERRAVEKALRQHQGNISRAAQDLGITRASLYRRMDKHGL